VTRHALAGTAVQRLSGAAVDLTRPTLALPPYAAWWLTTAPG
jgi:hypothetical protein